MASFITFLILFPLIFFIHGSTVFPNPVLPKAAILPVVKDLSTLQYVTKFFIGENLAPVNVVVDLGGPFLWIDCEFMSLFSSHQPIESLSLHCSMVKKSSDCVGKGRMQNNSKTCALLAENTISKTSTSGELIKDRIGVKFLDGVESGSLASINNFLFSCAPRLLLKGLANGANGMLGLGYSRISFPSQFSSTFSFFHRKFSMCLSPSNGAIFLGGNPSENEASISMLYTSLISKKDGVQEGYYINLNSIKISGKKLCLNPKGFLGGTKISTVVPYTTMESKMYGTFVEAYVKAATSMNMTSVAPVAPFEFCFSSNDLENRRVMPNVPVIDLVLQSELVKWRILGRNSMVPISDEVMCLGFFNGGLNPRDSIVIGGYQLENHILEFNLESSMLGFSSSLGMGKECSDFQGSSMYRNIS